MSGALSSLSHFILMSSSGVSLEDKGAALERKLGEAEADLAEAKAKLGRAEADLAEAKANDDKEKELMYGAMVTSFCAMVTSIHNELASLRKQASGKFGSLVFLLSRLFIIQNLNDFI
jgi:flagellar biosynthesis/type III secretory pathway protein FliH